MKPETVKVIIGLQPTTIEWDSRGGMELNYMVIAIMVPLLRADQDGNCGIVHYS